MRVLAAFLLVALPLGLAGCSEDPGESGPVDEGVVLVTDPTQELDMADTRPHLHDYWGGKGVIDIMEETVAVDSGTPLPAGGILSFGGGLIPGVEFRPPAGGVIPQGASEVVVTLTWTDDAPMNAFGIPQLAVKTAQDNQPWNAGQVRSGEPVRIASTNERNDLPHQRLSAWVFQWLLPSDGGPYTAYNGEVTIKVQAVRGLDIPLYPGHPDAWGARTEIRLFEASQDVFYDGDPTTGNWRCYGACPVIHVPGEGVIVPAGASHVSVTLTLQNGQPSSVGLKYHGADSREFLVASPDSGSTATQKTYTIAVGGKEDGPYAKQSLWEFVPFVEGPVPDGLVYDHYTLTAMVHKAG